FPAFAAEGSPADRAREVAAFFAQIAHETTGGWPAAPGGATSWGLCFVEQHGCENGGCDAYCADDPRWPRAPGASYHGRGAIQLSWNYNYGPAGAALGVDLLAAPDRVAGDGETAFGTALWFWMTAHAPKPSCHDAITGRWTPDADDRAAGREP